jgi:hypothetical protein
VISGNAVRDARTMRLIGLAALSVAVFIHSAYLAAGSSNRWIWFVAIAATAP